MTHIAEERNIRADAKTIWSVVSDTARWPEFLRSPDGRLRLTKVDWVEGHREEVGAVRRLTIQPHGTLDERITRWEPGQAMEFRGVRTPGFAYTQQIIELIPGRGFTTLRWDLYYALAGFAFFRKGPTKRALEDAVLHALEAIGNEAEGVDVKSDAREAATPPKPR